MGAMNMEYVIPAVSCTRNDWFATRHKKTRGSHIITRQSVKNAMFCLYHKKIFNHSPKEIFTSNRNIAFSVDIRVHIYIFKRYDEVQIHLRGKYFFVALIGVQIYFWIFTISHVAAI